jgi:hypothetical protein
MMPRCTESEGPVTTRSVGTSGLRPLCYSRKPAESGPHSVDWHMRVRSVAHYAFS